MATLCVTLWPVVAGSENSLVQFSRGFVKDLTSTGSRNLENCTPHPGHPNGQFLPFANNESGVMS